MVHYTSRDNLVRPEPPQNLYTRYPRGAGTEEDDVTVSVSAEEEALLEAGHQDPDSVPEREWSQVLQGRRPDRTGSDRFITRTSLNFSHCRCSSVVLRQKPDQNQMF